MHPESLCMPVLLVIQIASSLSLHMLKQEWEEASMREHWYPGAEEPRSKLHAFLPLMRPSGGKDTSELGWVKGVFIHTDLTCTPMPLRRSPDGSSAEKIRAKVSPGSPMFT